MSSSYWGSGGYRRHTSQLPDNAAGQVFGFGAGAGAGGDTDCGQVWQESAFSVTCTQLGWFGTGVVQMLYPPS